MKIVLVFSNVREKNVFEQSEHMKKMETSHPIIQYTIADTIDQVLNIFKEIETIEVMRSCLNTTMCSRCSNSDDDFLFNVTLNKYYERLSILLRTNQGLVYALGFSHPNLDIICAIAQEFSFVGKIAGTGEGGYAFILLSPNKSDELVNQLLNKINSYN